MDRIGDNGMKEIQCNDLVMHVSGDLPTIGEKAPEFNLTDSDLNEVTLAQYSNKAILINVYPSLDTAVCFGSVNYFREAVRGKNIDTFCVSMDLPFTLKRIRDGEDVKELLLLSDYKNRDFIRHYGIGIHDGPLKNCLARAIFVLDKSHNMVYHELVKDIANPPNYEAALKAVSGM